jgi:hypothetical protein
MASTGRPFVTINSKARILTQAAMDPTAAFRNDAPNQMAHSRY